jgi:hypothetical protein
LKNYHKFCGKVITSLLINRFEEKEVSYSNLMGFQSQEKYNCFSIHPYSHLGEKNGS